jgi:SAM-dependent methyltransferase
VQHELPGIKPFLADVFYGLPSLFKQKQEMVRQTLELLGDRREFDGYVEIGGTGRYMGALKKQLRLTGPLVLINDVAPTNSPVDIAERGQLGALGKFIPLNDYAPIGSGIADASVDFVSCYIGLHHITPPRVPPFIESIARILRPGGVFILRDHDVKTPEMFAFVALAHAVFNAGLNVPWETNHAELRHFTSIADWVDRLAKAGLVDTGKHLLQAHDPTDNTLMAFVKTPRAA